MDGRRGDTNLAATCLTRLTCQEYGSHTICMSLPRDGTISDCCRSGRGWRRRLIVRVDHDVCSGTAHCQQSMPEVFVLINRKSHVRQQLSHHQPSVLACPSAPLATWTPPAGPRASNRGSNRNRNDHRPANNVREQRTSSAATSMNIGARPWTPKDGKVELRGIEPLTPSMPWKCSAN
jgi:ferredoxin